jgi:hypothetical protein
MGKLKRRAERYNKNLTIDLFLRDDSASSLLAGPVPCFVNDLSSYGAGLILNQIHFNGHHLFYAPEDNPNYQLYIERNVDEKELLSIPVRPVWFNLDDHDEVHYFQLGVEFLAKANDDRVLALKKAAAMNLEKDGGWFGKLLLNLWK